MRIVWRSVTDRQTDRQTDSVTRRRVQSVAVQSVAVQRRAAGVAGDGGLDAA